MSKQRTSFKWNVTVIVPGSFLGILDNVISILTLGYWSPGWQLDYLFWASERAYRLKIAKQQDPPPCKHNWQEEWSYRLDAAQLRCQRCGKVKSLSDQEPA